MEKKIRVMIIDDSAVICAMLKQKLDQTGEIEVVATAPNPYEARDQVVLLDPDVIILDIEMPKMDGLTFLEKLMKHFPKPVIILSSLTSEGSETALKALEIGAVEVMSKAELSMQSEEFLAGIKEKIITASRSKVRKKRRAYEGRVLEVKDADLGKKDRFIFMGSSTGGTEALKVILTRFPSDFPPILVVQHMPLYFTRAFADHLSTLCRMKVKEAEEGDKVLAGHVYIAPGDRHLLIRQAGLDHVVCLSTGPRVNYQRPSVDILFKSAAQAVKEKGIGVILTGMGKDGAEGLLQMKAAGAPTIAQDQESSVVYGMPEAAVKLGAVDHVVSLENISEKILELLIEKR